MRTWLTLGFVLASVALYACIWDSDTLEAEAKGLPGVVEAIAGRIDINPPLYYEIRLKRATRDLERNPGNLGAYDDAAVAHDRLGRSDPAIFLMAKKKLTLDQLAPSDDRSEHLYRYHANLGTFYAHKWLGISDKSDVSLLKRAVQELEFALKLNPDAHFGREIVQVNLLKLIIEDRAVESVTHRPAISEWRSMVEEIGSEKVATGLIGIMALGAGSESIDIVQILSGMNNRASSVGQLGVLRIKELKRLGKKSVLSERTLGAFHVSGMPSDKESIQAAFADLRSNAKEYQARRTEFMLSRLATGSHPDTDPHFWEGYEPVAPLALDKYQSWRRFSNDPNLPARIAVPVAIAATGVATLALIARAIWRRRRG